MSAKKVLTPYNFNQNEIQNPVAGNLASAPSSPVKGQFYFDTGLNEWGVWNGTGWVYLGSGGGTVTAVSVVTTNGFAGTVANSTTTPAITLTTSITGILKGNGTAISAATSGTDYAPGTSANTTGLVKSTTSTGALTTAVAGTDYVGPTSGSSIQKANGSGGLTAATSGTDYSAGTSGLSTGIIKSTTTTGALTIAVAADFPTLNQNTSGTASNLSGTPALPSGTTGTTQTAGDNSTKLATTAYTDTAVSAAAQNFQYKPTATVATTSALPTGTYSNGSSGVGATFTVTATGTTTVDGHVLALNDLVLVTTQGSAFQNGLYVVTTAGTVGVSTVLTRHVDMDQSAEFPGAYVPVGSTGTANGNSIWLANPSGTVTVGTTNIPFTELNKATDLAAGAGIAISGNTVAIENSGVLTPTHGGTGITSLATGVATFLGTPSSANLAAAVTDETGSGALVFATSPALVTPALGTPASGVMTNVTGTAASLTAGKATVLATARTINGVSFDGSANITISATTKFIATIGDGSTTAIAVTHSLGTQDVIAQVRDASTNAVVECDVVQTSTSVTTFTFAVAPATNAYKVVIIG